MVNVPAPRDVEFTVTTEPEPMHMVVADGAVRLDMLGFAFTLNVAVLLDDTVLLHPPEAIPVTVTVVEPALASEPDGIVKVPVLEPIDRVAVAPVALFAPERLYVTVNVPVPMEVEFTVTVEAEPEQGDVADGEVKLVTFGFAFTVAEVV